MQAVWEVDVVPPETYQCPHDDRGTYRQPLSSGALGVVWCV